MYISKQHARLLFGLIVGLSVANGLVASEFSQKMSDKELCERLYAGYEKFGDGLVAQISVITDVPVDRCIKVLVDDQKALTEQIGALSYKNIIFSRKNAKNLLMTVGGAVGLLVADTFMQNKLADVSANIADELADAMHHGAAFFMNKKVRVHPSYDPKYEGNLKYSLQARDKTYQVKENMQALGYLRGPWGWFRGNPAGSSASGQVASKLLKSVGLSRFGYQLLGLDPYASDYTYSSYLSFYGLATKLLALSTAVGAFGLMQDIKDMQKTKQELIAQKDLDQKILSLLKAIA